MLYNTFAVFGTQNRVLRRSGTFSDFRLVKAENQTQSAVLIARARDAKMSDLPRMLHMSSGAKTLIIVADVHNAHRRSCSVGQTLKVETVGTSDSPTKSLY